MYIKSNFDFFHLIYFKFLKLLEDVLLLLHNSLEIIGNFTVY